MDLFRRHRPERIRFPAVPEARTYIEPGCDLSGQLRFKESVRIDGRVEGEVRAQGTVVVGETACVEATVIADTVVVLGEVDGEIRAEGHVTLYKSARVRGDVSAAGVAVEPGATFRGCIVIGDADGPALSVVPAGAAAPGGHDTERA